MKLIILRPQPGAAATAARAANAKIEVVVSPMFAGRPLAWQPPDPADFDALLLTSANAVRYGGAALASYRRLPVYAVGQATAAVVRESGFADVTVGAGNAPALLAEIALGPHRRLLHLCGVHRRATRAAGVQVRDVAVYAMEAASSLTAEAEAACRAGAVVMVHSPRAATLVDDLVDREGIDRAGIKLVAISEAAARAAGSGWCEVVASPAPTDAAMLAIARALCDRGTS